MHNKQIIIYGKNNNDKINLINTGEKGKRILMEHVEVEHREQIIYVNHIYMNMNNNNEYDYDNDNIIKKSIKNLMMREIEKKINGYKQQDIKKQIYDSMKIINFDDVIEKLVISKLCCFYCRTKILILYPNVREPTQWTLDRKDNDECHSKENTIISCLKCNLQRRVIDIDKFTFTKHLKIKKNNI